MQADFGLTRGRSWVDLDSTCSRQSIRNRLAFDTDRPGSNQTRSGSTRGVDPDRPGIDQGSTRSRRSIRDRSGVDPDRSGIDPGSIRIDRDRSGVGPGSAWDRPSFSPQSIRIDRDQPGIEPVPIRNDAPTQNTTGSDPQSAFDQGFIWSRAGIDPGLSIDTAIESVSHRARSPSGIDPGSIRIDRSASTRDPFGSTRAAVGGRFGLSRGLSGSIRDRVRGRTGSGSIRIDAGSIRGRPLDSSRPAARSEPLRKSIRVDPGFSQNRRAVIGRPGTDPESTGGSTRGRPGIGGRSGIDGE